MAVKDLSECRVLVVDDPRRVVHCGGRDPAAYPGPAGGHAGRDLRRLNDELAAQNPRDMFVTLVCLDVRAGKVTCANAGHDTSLLLDDITILALRRTSGDNANPPRGES